MRKPWEESGSHREFGADHGRRMDRRRDDRGQFERRSDRREEGFGRREDGFGRREGGFERRSFEARRFDRSDRFDGRRGDRDGNRSFGRRPTRGGFGGPRREERNDNVFGVRSGPRARAAVLNRRESTRAFDSTNATRNALVTLDADVARVFGSSEAVNAALRQLIALAQLMGPQALAQAAKEEVSEEQAQEATEETVDASEEQVQEVETVAQEADVSAQDDADEEDEEWFEIPTEAK